MPSGAPAIHPPPAAHRGNRPPVLLRVPRQFGLGAKRSAVADWLHRTTNGRRRSADPPLAAPVSSEAETARTTDDTQPRFAGRMLTPLATAALRSLRQGLRILPATGGTLVRWGKRGANNIQTCLWLTAIAVTCVSGLALVIGALPSDEPTAAAIESDDGDDGTTPAEGVSVPEAPPDGHAPPRLLSPPVRPISAVQPDQPGIVVQSAVHQTSSVPAARGAWLAGTIEADESAPAPRARHDASRPQPQ